MSSEGYILNVVQTPAPMRTLYQSIERGNATKKELQEDTNLPENLLEQGLSGLQLLRMVGREEHSWYTSGLEWETGDFNRDFRLTALHNLAAECDPDDWGKQAVALLNYQYLLQNDVQSFTSNDEVLYQEIDEWERDKDFRPESSQGPISHNSVKFVNWTRLVEFLGLVHKAKGRDHTVYPDPELIYHSIKLAVEERNQGRSELSTVEYIDWLQSNLLPVELTSDGEVPPILARILYTLVREGEIRIVESGDAGVVRLGRVPSHAGIDRQPNTIRLQ
ncbi:hypothetical protein [Haloprofundus marisrubri]|uniref:hypothetical protein n=1 Tax=Haloprofundus marisrubri TaxID=1514971 RepID=UPI0009E51BC1|nr:hypothetical protein [Haloprofundus marisrubri]